MNARHLTSVPSPVHSDTPEAVEFCGRPADDFDARIAAFQQAHAHEQDVPPTDAELDAMFVAEMERRDRETRERVSTDARVAAGNIRALQAVMSLFSRTA